MHRVSQKIKSLLFLTSTLLLFFLPLPLKAADCQVLVETSDPSSLAPKEIERQIQSYFKSHSCKPVLTDAPITYRITDIFEEAGIIYTFGFLSQGKSCVLALLSIENGWFSTTTNLLYMLIDFLPPTPLLFKDIVSAAQAMLPKSLAHCPVLIRPFENAPDEGHWQIWSFYNQSEWADLIISTTPTPDGGNEFAIMLPRK